MNATIASLDTQIEIITKEMAGCYRTLEQRPANANSLVLLEALSAKYEELTATRDSEKIRSAIIQEIERDEDCQGALTSVIPYEVGEKQAWGKKEVRTELNRMHKEGLLDKRGGKGSRTYGRQIVWSVK